MHGVCYLPLQNRRVIYYWIMQYIGKQQYNYTFQVSSYMQMFALAQQNCCSNTYINK